MPQQLSEQQIVALRELIVDPIVERVEEKINNSNAHQLQRIEQICKDAAVTLADVAQLKLDVKDLKGFKAKLFWIASLIGTIVGLVWGWALDWARKHHWIQ